MKRLRKIWKWTWRTSVVLVVVLYLLRNLVVAPFAVGKAQPAIAEALGMELEIQGFGGSWLGGLTLDQVQSNGEGNKTPLKSVTLKGLEVDYSLWGLLRGDEHWLKSVTVAELAVALDLDQTTPSVDEEEVSEPSALPAYLPPVTVHQLSLELWQGDVHLQVPNATLASEWGPSLAPDPSSGQDSGEMILADAEAVTVVRLATEKTLFSRGGEQQPALDLGLSLQYADGRLSIDELLVNGIERVHTGWADLRNAHLGELNFDFDLSVMDGEIKASGALKDRHLDASLLATGLQAETLNPWLDLGLRGELQVQAKAAIPLDDPRAGTAELKFGAHQNGWQKLELQAIDGSVELKDGWLSTNQFSAVGDGLDLRADGVRLPLFEPVEKWNAQGHFSLAVEDLPAWLHRSGVELPAEVDLLHGLTLDGTLTSHSGGLRVAMAQFELSSELGNLVADADVDLALDGLSFQGLSQETPVQFNASFDGLDLQDLLERVVPDGQPNPLLSGRSDLEVALSGPPSDPKLALQLKLREVVPAQEIPGMESLPIAGIIKLDYADDKLRLRVPQLKSSVWRFTGQGEYFDLHLNLNDLIAGEALELNGPFEVMSSARVNNPAWVQGVVNAHINCAGELAHGSLDELSWDTKLFSDALTPPADLRPYLGDDEVLLERLADVSLQLMMVEFDGGWKPDQMQPLSATALVSDMDSGNGLPVTLAVGLNWSDNMLRLTEARLASEQLNFGADAEMPLDIQQLLQASPSAEADGGASLLPAEMPLKLSAKLAQFDLGQLQQLAQPWAEVPEVSGSLDEVALSVAGTWSKPTLQARVQARQILIPGQDGTLLPDPADLDLDIHYQDGVAKIEQLSANAPQIQIAGGGMWRGELDFSALANGEPMPSGELDFHGKLDSPDLTWLGATGAVRRAEGALVANWKITGEATAPVIHADWELQNGAMRLNSASTGAMENLTVRGSFEDGLLTLAHIEGDLGSAPFTAGGTVDLRADAAEVVDPKLDIQLNGTDLLLFRQQGVKLRSDADLHIHGPMSALKVEGDIELTDGRYTKPVDFFLPLLKEGSPPSAGVEGISLFSLAPPLDGMIFDVAVHPGSGFRVKTNVANGLIEPKLRLVGTGEVPYLLGEVYIDRFLLSLPANNIRIERGAVRFLEANPFIPTLDIRAGYRRFGYDVTILVHGDLSAPEITMSSIPPLQAEELLLLTTTGQPPTESADAEAALGTVAVYLAKDWIRRFFGDMSTEAEESMLDRLEIEFGRDATQQGAETIEGRFLLREQYFRDNDALFLTGERDAYGDFNLGFRIRFLFP
jgi:autotransporter translocation and assembly factor TamB